MSQQTLNPQMLSAIASGEAFPNLVKLEDACARATEIWPDWKADFVTIRKKYYTEETAKYGVTILQSASEKLLALNTDEARKIVELGLTWEKPGNNMKENQKMRVIIKPSGGYSYGVRNNGGFRCFVPRVNHYTGQDARYEQELEEARRDAYLFAASADLLKELEETHAALCFTGDYVGSERYKRNKAAIEAAKGTQP